MALRAFMIKPETPIPVALRAMQSGGKYVAKPTMLDIETQMQAPKIMRSRYVSNIPIKVFGNAEAITGRSRLAAAIREKHPAILALAVNFCSNTTKKKFMTAWSTNSAAGNVNGTS